MKLFINTVMKRTYLFNTVAWNYGKKIGFPVCKKSARASPIPHHTWMKSGTLVSRPNLYPSWGWQSVGVRLRRARYFCPSSLPMRPRARLNLPPNLLSPLKDINRDWVRVCHTPLGVQDGGLDLHADSSGNRNAYFWIYKYPVEESTKWLFVSIARVLNCF